jgi:hypothetical protein
VGSCGDDSEVSLLEELKIELKTVVKKSIVEVDVSQGVGSLSLM